MGKITAEPNVFFFSSSSSSSSSSFLSSLSSSSYSSSSSSSSSCSSSSPPAKHDSYFYKLQSINGGLFHNERDPEDKTRTVDETISFSSMERENKWKQITEKSYLAVGEVGEGDRRVGEVGGRIEK